MSAATPAAAVKIAMKRPPMRGRAKRRGPRCVNFLEAACRPVARGKIKTPRPIGRSIRSGHEGISGLRRLRERPQGRLSPRPNSVASTPTLSSKAAVVTLSLAVAAVAKNVEVITLDHKREAPRHRRQHRPLRFEIQIASLKNYKPRGTENFSSIPLHTGFRMPLKWGDLRGASGDLAMIKHIFLALSIRRKGAKRHAESMTAERRRFAPDSVPSRFCPPILLLTAPGEAAERALPFALNTPRIVTLVVVLGVVGFAIVSAITLNRARQPRRGRERGAPHPRRRPQGRGRTDRGAARRRPRAAGRLAARAARRRSSPARCRRSPACRRTAPRSSPSAPGSSRNPPGGSTAPSRRCASPARPSPLPSPPAPAA